MSDRDRLIELLYRAHHNASAVMAGGEGSEFDGIAEEADYLLANGVVVPPCKVGDSLYLFYPVTKRINEVIVEEISLSVKDFFSYRYPVFFEQFGKTVFLSREAALKARDKDALD